MGLGAFLEKLEKSAQRQRLAYHGYTPEVIEQQRQFLAEQQAEHDAKVAHATAMEQREAEAADRAKQADIDRAAEAAEAKRAARFKSVKTQLDAGVYPDNIMGREDIDPGEFAALITASNQEAQAKREGDAVKKKQEAVSKAEADTAAEARDFENFKRREAYKRTHEKPGKPDDDPTDKPDPFETAARPIVMAAVNADINKTYTPAEIDSMIVAQADAMRKRRKGGASPIVDPAASAVARAKAAATGPLTAAEAAKVAKLDPESKADFAAKLASGNPAIIAKLRARLAQIQ